MAGDVEEKQRGGSLLRGEDHTPGPGSPRVGGTGSAEPQKLSRARCHSLPGRSHSKLSACQASTLTRVFHAVSHISKTVVAGKESDNVLCVAIRLMCVTSLC